MRKIAVVLLLSLGACLPRGVPGASSDGFDADLAGYLAVQGYTRIPMARLPTGHFAIAGLAGGVPFDLILDTGASHTVIDTERATRFDLLTEDQGSSAMGVGMSEQRIESARLDEVAIGVLRLGTLQVSVLDLSQINELLRRMGHGPVDGIMGADVLTARQAVIDYGGLSVFFRE